MAKKKPTETTDEVEAAGASEPMTMPYDAVEPMHVHAEYVGPVGYAPPEEGPPGQNKPQMPSDDQLQAWLLEGREAADVLARGEVVSIETLKRLVQTAVPVMESLQEDAKPKS